MADTSSISGGGSNTTLYTNLSPSGTAYALRALHALGTYNIEYLPGGPGTDNVFNVSSRAPDGTPVVPNATYSIPNGSGIEALVVDGDVPVTLDGSQGPYGEVLVGNNAGDIFNMGVGSGTIVTGDSDEGNPDVINTNGGRINVDEGGGIVLVNFQSNPNPGFANTINQTGTGSFNIDVASGSTLHLGTGNDTILAAGASTIYGGSGNELFYGGSGNTVFYAGPGAGSSGGPGSATIYGGLGNDTFYGSPLNPGQGDDAFSQPDSMIGGSAGNLFVAGFGNDTMVSGASLYGSGSTDIFEFSSASSISGGQHTIMGFTHGSDTIELVGYATSDVAMDNVVSGNTFILLDDGTSITVKGVTNLTESTMPGGVKFT